MSDHTIMVIWVIKTFSVYSCQLLISSASIRSIPFLAFILPIFALHISNFLIYIFSNFLEEISSLFHSIFYFFPSISLHWSLRKAFLSLLASLWISAFRWVYLSFSPLLLASVLFTAICKASSDSQFATKKREEGGGFRMGNTCIPVVDSFWYMAKPIQYCKVKK